jgi:hypothetical protein
MCNNVDFPLPTGPIIIVSLPSGMVKFKPLRMGFVTSSQLTDASWTCAELEYREVVVLRRCERPRT